MREGERGSAELGSDGVSKDDVVLGWVGRAGGGDTCPRGCTLLLLGQFLGEEGEVCAHCFQSPTGQSSAPVGINYPFQVARTRAWRGSGSGVSYITGQQGSPGRSCEE